MVTVILPGALGEYTGGEREVEIDASTVNEMVEKLDAMFPGLRFRICDEQGIVRRYVNVFVNGENLPHETAHTTKLNKSDSVHILPSIAGGTE